LRQIREPSPTIPIRRSQRKRLSFIDGIALLLVTEDGSDVAAVSFLQTSTSIDFYYAKNRPCTQEEIEYVESLLKITRNYDQSERSLYAWTIFTTAIHMCIRKVRSRIRKISRELDKLGVNISTLKVKNPHNLKIWQATSREGEILKELVYAYSLFEPTPDLTKSDECFLAGYFKFVLKMDAPIQDPLGNMIGLRQLVIVSQSIGMTIPVLWVRTSMCV